MRGVSVSSRDDKVCSIFEELLATEIVDRGQSKNIAPLIDG